MPKRYLSLGKISNAKQGFIFEVATGDSYRNPRQKCNKGISRRLSQTKKDFSILHLSVILKQLGNNATLDYIMTYFQNVCKTT